MQIRLKYTPLSNNCFH